MEPKVLERLESKIAEASERKSEIERLVDALGPKNVSPYSVLAGMLYNSFYYQTRRICSREPTGAEFSEFTEWVEKRRSQIESALG